MRVTSDEGLLRIDIDSQVHTAIENALGNLKSESRKVLKNAVNTTARQSRKALADKGAKEFATKQRTINQSMSIDKATISRPEATISAVGTALELGEFKTSASVSGVKAKVRKSEPLKVIQSNKGNRAKAFLATFESGHTAIVQRQEGKTYKGAEGAQKRKEKYGSGADMTLVKKLLSISAPQMIGDEKAVFGVLRPDIYENLMDNIAKEIDKVLKK